jgi:hypothetical protein
VIKTSALLVVLAIGLLVAGVLASSLPMVYVSIGVCAVAALLLAAGVLSHWSEIFGRREPRPSRVQPAWSEPQMQVSAPVLAGAQTAGAQVTGAQVTGAQTGGAQTGGAQTGARARDTAAREERRSRRGAAAGRSPAPPAEVVTSQAESAVPRRGDDLWQRVEEELGTAGKRDTGALSWPATEIPVLREPAGPPEEAGPPGGPPAGSSAWIWGRGAGWQPPETPDEAWPPPAAAFAGSPARPERATTDTDGPDGAGQDVDGPDQETGQPESAAPAGPARAADEAAPESVDDEVAGQARPIAAAKPDTWDERPRWIISVGDAAPARPVPGSAVSAPPARERTTGADAGQPAAGKPASGKPASGEPEAAQPGAGETKGAKPKAAETKGAKPGAADPKAAKPEPTTAAVAASAGQDAPGQPPAGPEAASREPAVDVPQAEEPTAGESGADDSAADDSAADDSAADDSAADDSAAEESPAEESAAEDSAAQGSAAGDSAAEESAAGEPAADSPAEKPAPGRIEVTVVPGVARYHRSECILIRFLGAGDLDIMTRQEADDAKFAACRACQPDQIEA